MSSPLTGRRVLLIISGGIAAYKSLDLIRRLKERGAELRCVLTKGGAQFVTPLSVAALSENDVYSDLWSLTDESKMGHIRLSREADVILVAPCSANLMAKMTHGLAEDLASTILLATNKTVILAPAMNGEMWNNEATRANVSVLKRRGIRFLGPDEGLMACGETGQGRLIEVAEILSALESFFSIKGPLSGKSVLVTAGPTFEPLDPVRFLGNRSSGKQGHAIALALQQKGAQIILVTGPTRLADPVGIRTVHVETAREMLSACEAELPVDLAVCAAAVADWRPKDQAPGKLKKGVSKPFLELVENPDILGILSSAGNRRPRLVVGFAAETENLLENAQKKLRLKGCDWIVANEVGLGKAFDEDENEVVLLRKEADDKIASIAFPRQTKSAIARQLADEIAAFFA